MVCVRSAWLVLGASTVLLEDPTQGYFCTELALPLAEVRSVVDNRPDQTGVTDRTQYLAARTVSATLWAAAGLGAVIDAVPGLFAPFMNPAARPVLHYVLDRPGTPERTLTLRATGFDWPIAGPDERDILLQWVTADDPISRDPNPKTVTAWSGSSTTPGRTYNLTFPRVYPASGGGPTTGSITNVGDVGIAALYRIYGPITAPIVQVNLPGVTRYMRFNATATIPAGQWIDIDTAARTIYWNSDPNSSAATVFNWVSSQFPVVPPGQTATMTLTGSSTSGVTQVQAIWNDGYLT